MVRGGRRVLFFAYYFPPLGGAGSQRALSFARHLPSHGWDVVVVAPREGVFGTDDSTSAEGLPGVHVVRTGTFEPAVLLRKVLPSRKAAKAVAGGQYVDEVDVGSVGGAIRDWARGKIYFPDSCRGWISHAMRAATKEHAKVPFDAVLSSSPPVSAHVAAQRFSRKHRVPWVADWRDPWTEYHGKDAPRSEEARRLEKTLLADAEGVLAATEGVGRILSRNGAGSPPVTVRNGFEAAAFHGVSRPPAEDGVFRILYTGTLYPPEMQFPGALFAAVRRILDSAPTPAIRIRFLGKVDPAAMSLARSAGIAESVEIAGFLPHGESVGEMSGARLLLVLTTNRTDAMGNIEVPAKTYEYLAARRPILALTDEGSEAARILGGRAGVWVRAQKDADGIEKALREAMALKNPVLPAWPDIDQFTRASQAAKLAGVLDRVVAEGKR